MTSIGRWLRRRLTFRLRSLLVVIAVIAVTLGAYLEVARRTERRRRWPYEILAAADAGDVPRIRRLLDEGAKVDSVTDGRFPWTPLMWAAWRGRTDAVKLLLERGANPDHEDLDCIRAITLAASERHWEIVRLLVDSGADPTSSDYASKTALDYAREKGVARRFGGWNQKLEMNPEPVAHTTSNLTKKRMGDG